MNKTNKHEKRNINTKHNQTQTNTDASGDFQHKTPQGRNIRYGVREHAMSSISNGLAAYGGFIPYCATFFNFIE